MDTPQTVMTTRAPAVLKPLTNQVYVDQRPVYNMVSLRLERKGRYKKFILSPKNASVLSSLISVEQNR